MAAGMPGAPLVAFQIFTSVRLFPLPPTSSSDFLAWPSTTLKASRLWRTCAMPAKNYANLALEGHRGKKTT